MGGVALSCVGLRVGTVDTAVWSWYGILNGRRGNVSGSSGGSSGRAGREYFAYSLTVSLVFVQYAYTSIRVCGGYSNLYSTPLNSVYDRLYEHIYLVSVPNATCNAERVQMYMYTIDIPTCLHFCTPTSYSTTPSHHLHSPPSASLLEIECCT